MPTYEYKCDACGHAFERFQSITAAPIKRCPSCEKNKVRRLIGTGAGLIFKGSGFYITDYRSEGYKSAEKADGGSSSSAGTGDKGGASNGKSESTAATPAAATPAPAAPAPAAKAESKPAAKKK